ncbi:hypothetical protein Kpol_1024p46 [Vanderwaltozyma polyspora DSM 70294]|uniref:Uncharacterized protein n=1 Tax=Vanderwaltozyma polyspora (strain ATCC 22028 / DSM 70294 / BCRC 21397 / CBS 2163 / NBRC 10782 / NRRL Y-8283 / UCD 57-17) TaxID=436907 RepID=A7TLK6_VANPO|nr:uncharacterized protein Kpol_1024p46 [Vanderwaltozyma polyspora DSM 70294]EDO16892.1 hypothetical protein Kpol_1024p46 [Vanderwaltozyma polyspora DSM 70294]
MAISSIFKAKRPHSPDNIGISNYKKQRLIEDFSNLRIGDTPSSKVNLAENVPINVKIHAPNFLDTDSKFDSVHDFYSKIYEQLINERLQLIKWVDPKKLLYEKWFEWVKSRIAPINSGYNEEDDDMMIDDGYNNYMMDYDNDTPMD